MPLHVSIETELLLELKILRFVFLFMLFETCANFIRIEGQICGFPFYWQVVEPVSSEEKEATQGRFLLTLDTSEERYTGSSRSKACFSVVGRVIIWV